MNNIERYLEKKNSLCEVFGQPLHPYPETREQVNELIEDVEVDLSPENLTCDGELPREQVNNRLSHLRSVLKELNELFEKL